MRATLPVLCALALAGCPRGCKPGPRADRWDEKQAAHLADIAAARAAHRLGGGDGDGGTGPGQGQGPADDEETPRPETERVDTLVIALPDDPAGLNPALEPDLMTRAVTWGTIYEPMLRWRSTTSAQAVLAPAPGDAGAALAGPGPAPGVCDNWSVDVSGRRVELQIRDGARWQDGRAVSSSDLQFTLDTLRGGDSRAVRLRALLADIDRVELAGPRKVRILYRRATTFALRNLAEVPVLPQHLLSAADVMQQRAFKRPIGSGPWRLVRWKRGEQILLSRWDGYDLARPHYRWLEMVIDPDGARVLTRAKQGDIDVITRVPPSYVPDQITSPAVAKAFERRDLAPPRFLYLVMNTRKGEPLDDLRMRRVIAALVDRKHLVEVGYQGRAVALATPVWPGGPVSGPAAAPPGAPSIELAKRLLDYADWWRHDKDGFRERLGKRLTMRMLAASGPLTHAVTEQLVPAAREAGIALTAAKADPAFIMAKLREGEFDLALLEYGAIPDEDLGDLLGSGGALNYGAVTDPEIDAALEALRRVEGAARSEAGARLSRVMIERLPILTLARPENVALVRRGIQGLDVEAGWFTVNAAHPAATP